jgi:hypothetical protein
MKTRVVIVLLALVGTALVAPPRLLAQHIRVAPARAGGGWGGAASYLLSKVIQTAAKSKPSDPSTRQTMPSPGEKRLENIVMVVCWIVVGAILILLALLGIGMYLDRPKY